jgi:hypothetical protein
VQVAEFEERPLRGAILMSHDIVDSVSRDRRPVDLCDLLVNCGLGQEWLHTVCVFCISFPST